MRRRSGRCARTVPPALPEVTAHRAASATHLILVLVLFLAIPASVRADYTAAVNPGSVLVTNFQGWGTSLQWWANVVGGYPNRTNYINLLFNTLKLNVVRYEIGAGQNPAVDNPRTPYKAMMQGFELTNGMWNWNADLNQRWVLRQAEANGANLVEAFAVSAPWWMCVSSNVDGNMEGTNNLQTDCETNFAIYLATVISNLTVLDGDHFDYVIPMNEPSLGTVGQITNGYETCHMSNDQQQRVINDLRAQLNTDAPSVGVDAPGDYDEYEAYNDVTEYSATTLSNLALFSTHSYIENDPARLSAEAAAHGKPLWVAEYGDSDSTGMKMARQIYNDITGMKIQAWIYWMAVNADAGNAFLYNGLVASTNAGYSISYLTYEKFYVMGQFSEFIRPGCEIISVNDTNTLAAWNSTNATLVLVTVNTNSSSLKVTYNLSDFGPAQWQMSETQTANGENMAAQSAPAVSNGQFTAAIPAGSVTTFVLTTNQAPAIVNQSPAGHAFFLKLYSGETPEFSISATGNPPLEFQWFSNDLAVAAATNASFTPGALPVGISLFNCVVSNGLGSIGSTDWLVQVIAPPTASYAHAALALHPVDFWPLNEPEKGGGDDGVVATDYGGGNDGLYTNVVLGEPGYNPAADPATTAALFGSLASSNSAVSEIQNMDFSEPAGSNVEFSVSAWVNGSGSAQNVNAGIVTKGYFYGEELDLDEGAPGADFRFEARNAAGAAFNADSAINATNSSPNNGWYHLAGVCDEANGNVLLYVNGALAGTAAISRQSGIMDSAPVPITIGARASSAASGNDNQFYGRICDVAIYDYPLNSNQVRTLYEAGALSPETLAFTNAEPGSLELDWVSGVLQIATNAAGPYSDLTNATSPFVAPLTNIRRFFRIKEN
ncbi:MAG: LamG-like jellyroll fold domain-containing protein [Limisphaerales bacterium]